MAEERGRAMRIPKNRNDRVMLVTMSALVGLGLAVGLSLMPPIQLQATSDASAANSEFAPPKSYTAIPPSGPMPLAHTTHKIVHTDGPVSVVRDPADMPIPIGKRESRRLRVDLETVEVTGKLADGATYRYWTF